MNIRGLDKFTLVDYPGKIGCIVFCGGCNLRCPFCHNPCLVFDPASQPRVTEKELFHFLSHRGGLIEGVVISGGEPMLQEDLEAFVHDVREMGFLAKLDTNGTFPEKLEHLIGAVGIDSLGIDYKGPCGQYGRLTGTGDDALGKNTARSIRMAVERNIELDVRTTVHRALLSEADLRTMYGELKALGVKRWMLQQFNPVEVIDDDLPKQPTYTDLELVKLAKVLGPEVKVRGLSGRVIA